MRVGSDSNICTHTHGMRKINRLDQFISNQIGNSEKKTYDWRWLCGVVGGRRWRWC